MPLSAPRPCPHARADAIARAAQVLALPADLQKLLERRSPMVQTVLGDGGVVLGDLTIASVVARDAVGDSAQCSRRLCPALRVEQAFCLGSGLRHLSRQRRLTFLVLGRRGKLGDGGLGGARTTHQRERQLGLGRGRGAAGGCEKHQEQEPTASHERNVSGMMPCRRSQRCTCARSLP
jgi:hypothetical protein